MRFLNRISLVIAFSLSMLLGSNCRAQIETPTTEKKASASSDADAQEKNLQAYVDLLRTNVRQQKAEIMGAVMLLSTDDAAKFWPIYNEYDAELTKLNNQRVENIKEYARNYTQMTDDKANELIQRSLAFQKQRSELYAKTYDRVKQALGGIAAARFAQVENQLLLLIDLQITSSLPIVGSGS